MSSSRPQSSSSAGASSHTMTTSAGSAVNPTANPAANSTANTTTSSHSSGNSTPISSTPNAHHRKVINSGLGATGDKRNSFENYSQLELSQNHFLTPKHTKRQSMGHSRHGSQHRNQLPQSGSSSSISDPSITPFKNHSNNTSNHTHSSSGKKRLSQQQQRSSFISNSTSNSKLDYFTNNHFSRSFNSLILDDIKDELNVATANKRKLNKSPPFNVKQDLYMGIDSIDDCLDDSFDPNNDNDATKNNETQDTMTDDDNDAQFTNNSDDNDYPALRIIKPKKLRPQKSTSHDEADNAMITVETPPKSATLQKSVGSSNSQQSLIKRSSKFFNLSIDSSNNNNGSPTTLNAGKRAPPGVAPPKLPKLSTNKAKIDAENIKTTKNGETSREGTPIEASSPLILNQGNAYTNQISSVNTTPFKNNKFKRPHQLISQSPSPSSSKTVTSKEYYYNSSGQNPRINIAKTTSPMRIENDRHSSSFQQFQQAQANNGRTTSNDTAASASISQLDQQQNLYSPSKLGLKGFKMFKNSDKMAIISPNRSAPSNSKACSNVFVGGETLTLPNSTANHNHNYPYSLDPSRSSRVRSHKVPQVQSKLRKSSLNNSANASTPNANAVSMKRLNDNTIATDNESTTAINDNDNNMDAFSVNQSSPSRVLSSSKPGSSPLINGFNFDYYNLDKLDVMDLDDLDSPSKNRKLSNSSVTSNGYTSKDPLVIYRDSDQDIMSNHHRKLRNSTGLKHINSNDNKENESFAPLSKYHQYLQNAHNQSTTMTSSSGGPKSSYKFVKPLQTAFKSSGLMKKNSIPGNLDIQSRKFPPETPIKKNPLLMISGTNSVTSAPSTSAQSANSHNYIPNSLTSNYPVRNSSLSNLISSAHDESVASSSTPHPIEENSEISIEIGRNNSHLSHSGNDSTQNLSFFKIPPPSANDKNMHLLNTNDLDLDLGSEFDYALNENEIIPETPTKSVKKSYSMPASFSPMALKKQQQQKEQPSERAQSAEADGSSQKSKKINLKLSINNKFSERPDEPSTPTNFIHLKALENKSSSIPIKLDTIDSSESTIIHQSSNRNFFTKHDHEGDSHTHSVANNNIHATKIDDHLINKFGLKNLKFLGTGEFSVAFECSFQDQKFAIKRSKKPVLGKLERKAILREIEALRMLSSVEDNDNLNMQEQEDGKEYLVYFIEAWDFSHYYYIMTEYCEGGTLFDFLEDNKNYKIDEFRVWKILIEILTGLKFIHSKNYLHLDLKPANIFITFEGSLKIGDFGLATKLPILEKDFDLEGDRNYIAPELINDKIYTPFADVFSVGLIILEIATNIILPENGTPWRKLRSGDLSDAGKLSSDNISDYLHHQNFSSLTSYNSIGLSSTSSLSNGPHSHNNNSNTVLPHQRPVSGSNLNPSFNGVNHVNPSIESIKELIPQDAPDFLVYNSNNLDKMVTKMLKPVPFDRPTAKMILQMPECQIIESRRKAGATIFEGEFGPGGDDD